MKTLPPLALLVLSCFLVGFATCHGEGDRNLVHQSREAGAMIEAHPDSPPEVKQAGADVKQNMVVLQNSVGAPEAPKPYSPQASAETRVQAEKEQKEPPAPVSFLSNLVGTYFPWAGSAILAGWGIFERLSKSKVKTRLTAVYQGVEDVKAVAATGRVLSPEMLITVLKTAASAYNVYPEIKEELRALKEDGKVTSHPTAPAIQPPPPIVPPTTPA